MSSQIYDWKRFWCPREGNINLSDGGYLVDPESKYRKIENPDVVPFESIAQTPCLVLLGEPGIGKTHAMQSEKRAIDSKITSMGGMTLWLNLRSYRSEDRLVRNLFESQEFISYLKGEYQLHIFLDSLDECLFKIDTLSALLVEEFNKYPIENLFLRLACRTADWPRGLEDGLKQRWGRDSEGIYELAPLRRVDVTEAAKRKILDHEAFLREVDQKGVVPFAIKPVTLEFLLNTYHRNNQLPSTQAEIYLQGCRLLCEETSESRREARLTGDFNAEQRMAVAARIAAVTIFANRYAIWTGVDRGDVPDEDITIRELSGGSEGAEIEQFQVTEAAILETLSTGLFSSRGPNRIGWAHQTYAEFLSARYLSQHNLTLTQMMSLLIHPGDSEGKIVPQLHESAAWLASMIPTVFQEILKNDPEVLLRSSVELDEEKNRETLVGTLLGLYEEGKLLDHGMNIRLGYKRLSHLNLAEQLRPYICSKSKDSIVRQVAIDIAEACNSQTLQEELADIALDHKQPLRIRENAAYAVIRIGDTATKAKFKPLATGSVGDDPYDELKGCGLLAVWPDHITVEELLTIITRRKRRNFYGAYLRFLASEFVPHLKPSDLPAALRWVNEQQPRQLLSHTFEELEDAIMLKGWEHLDSEEVLEAFAKTTLTQLRLHGEISHDRRKLTLEKMIRENDTKRRRLLETIMPILLDQKKNSELYAFSRTPVVMSKDVLWMIERLKSAKCKNYQRAWAQLINGAFDWGEQGECYEIYVASQSNMILADAFAWLFKPIELDSPEAQEKKKDYLRLKKRQTSIPKRTLLDPPPVQQISTLLDESEYGKYESWWYLTMVMTLKPDSMRYHSEIEMKSDLTILPGWKTANETTRKRILKAAKKYVLEQSPETSSWLGKNIYHRPALAGFKALRLLMHQEPSFISSIPADVWKRWAPIILAYPQSNDIGDKEAHSHLLKFAYGHAIDIITHCLKVIIDKENEDHDAIFIINVIDFCWDDRLASTILSKAKDEKLKPECMGCLLSALLKHNVAEARVFTEKLVQVTIPSSGIERSRAIVAALVLMIYTDNAGWSVVWPAIQEDIDFGKQVISKLVDHLTIHGASIGQKLHENQLADLIIWLFRHYPLSQDSIGEDGFLYPRDNVARWRDSMLRELKERSNAQACEAIERIAFALPDILELKQLLKEAKTIARRHSWMPPNPVDVVNIAMDEEKRLVQNGDQLLNVLIESLQRLQEKLIGKTPSTILLWNEIEKDLYRPKDESILSDYVKVYLDDDLKQRGIIVNREVEIRKGRGSSPGEETDIHVDAIIPGSRKGECGSVSAIIEVKGCWHRELWTAMETQLVDRYLKDNRCPYGLYVVGWFNCDKWDNRDYRKKQAPKMSSSEVQDRLDTQASELSKQIRAFVIDIAIR